MNATSKSADTAPDWAPYADIIDLPHPVSERHPQMAMRERAAQFAPFRALSGYEQAIWETTRQTDAPPSPDESRAAALNEKLLLLQAYQEERPEVSVTFFRPDERKEGGAYATVSGRLKRIDPVENRLLLLSGERIPIADITALESRLFALLEAPQT